MDDSIQPLVELLPPELLARIFQHHITTGPPINFSFDINALSRQQPSLLAVCRKWRRTALNSPECWTSLHLRANFIRLHSGQGQALITPFYEIIKSRFRLAKSHPLSLVVELYNIDIENTALLGQLFVDCLPVLQTYSETGGCGIFTDILPFLHEKIYQNLTYLMIIDETTVSPHLTFQKETQSRGPYRLPSLQGFHIASDNVAKSLGRFLRLQQVRTFGISGTERGLSPSKLLHVLHEQLPGIHTLFIDVDALAEVFKRALRVPVPHHPHHALQILVIEKYNYGLSPDYWAELLGQSFPVDMTHRVSIEPLIRLFPKLMDLVLPSLLSMLRYRLDEPTRSIPISGFRILRGFGNPRGTQWRKLKDHLQEMTICASDFFTSFDQLQFLQLGLPEGDDDFDTEYSNWFPFPEGSPNSWEFASEDVRFVLRLLNETSPAHCPNLIRLGIASAVLDHAVLSHLLTLLHDRSGAGLVLSIRKCQYEYTGTEYATHVTFPEMTNVGHAGFKERLSAFMAKPLTTSGQLSPSRIV